MADTATLAARSGNPVTISFRPARVDDAEAISALILSLSAFFLEDPLSPKAETFLATMAPPEVRERIAAANFQYLLAEVESGLCGIVAMRDGSHLYHLFVRPDMHGQGLGRELWQRAKVLSAPGPITVNSSLFAIPIYQQLGFVAVGHAQTMDGLTFQPMVHDPG